MYSCVSRVLYWKRLPSISVIRLSVSHLNKRMSEDSLLRMRSFHAMCTGV